MLRNSCVRIYFLFKYSVCILSALEYLFKIEAHERENLSRRDAH